MWNHCIGTFRNLLHRCVLGREVMHDWLSWIIGATFRAIICNVDKGCFLNVIYCQAIILDYNRYLCNWSSMNANVLVIIVGARKSAFQIKENSEVFKMRRMDYDESQPANKLLISLISLVVLVHNVQSWMYLYILQFLQCQPVDIIYCSPISKHEYIRRQ